MLELADCRDPSEFMRAIDRLERMWGTPGIMRKALGLTCLWVMSVPSGTQDADTQTLMFANATFHLELANSRSSAVDRSSTAKRGHV